MSDEIRFQLAEAAFDAYYAHGGQGQADDVWRRIATKWGVLGLERSGSAAQPKGD